MCSVLCWSVILTQHARPFLRVFTTKGQHAAYCYLFQGVFGETAPNTDLTDKTNPPFLPILSSKLFLPVSMCFLVSTYFIVKTAFTCFMMFSVHGLRFYLFYRQNSFYLFQCVFGETGSQRGANWQSGAPPFLPAFTSKRQLRLKLAQVHPEFIGPGPAPC